MAKQNNFLGGKMKLFSAVLLAMTLVSAPAITFACKDKECGCKHEGKACSGDEKKSCGEKCEGNKKGKCTCDHEKGEHAGHEAKATDTKTDAKKDEKKK